jgi:hypothetical protein
MPRGVSRAQESHRARFVSRVLLLFVTTSLPGCVHWSEAKAPAPQAFPAREQVKVWTGNRSVRLQSVRIEAESLSGTPYKDSPTCDSCRVSLPSSAVDSIQTGKSPEALSIAIIAIPIAAFVLLLAMFSTGWD